MVWYFFKTLIHIETKEDPMSIIADPFCEKLLHCATYTISACF